MGKHNTDSEKSLARAAAHGGLAKEALHAGSRRAHASPAQHAIHEHRVLLLAKIREHRLPAQQANEAISSARYAPSNPR
jgi:hypothetical protein